MKANTSLFTTVIKSKKLGLGLKQMSHETTSGTP